MDGAANSSASVIWSRSGPRDANDTSSVDDDVDIDDEALIRAYERSRRIALSKLRSAEEEVKKKPIKSVLKTKVTSDQPKMTSTNGENKNQHASGWKVGDHCMAIYDNDDGRYEAEIIEISKSSQTCTIRYCGYEEEDVKSFEELAPCASEHVEHIVKPPSQHNSRCGSCGCPPGSASTQSPQAFILPPPLSPSALPLLQSPSGPSSSTLHCALMSWYMAGFHTGYHQAVMDLRAKEEKRDAAASSSPHSTSQPSGCCANSSNGQNRSMTKKPSPV